MSPLPPTRDRPVLPQFDATGLPQAPSSSRSRTALRRLGIALIICFAVLLGAVAAAYFYTQNTISDLLTPQSAKMVQTQKELVAPLPGEPTNILLLGSDHRKFSKDDKTQRSDTLLLVRLDPKGKTISMMSFPRDLWVPIEGHGEAKINDAYTYGGPALSVKTIKAITGVDVNIVMNVDFTGFRGVVDQLGGIWVDVDRTYFDNVSNQTSDIDIKPGYQLLNGKDALAFARFRHDNRGDFNRIARQQLVLASLKKQVGASSLAKNVRGLFKVFHDNTEVVAGGGNQIDPRVLYDYMRLGLALDGKDVYEFEYKGETGEASNGASIVLYDEATMDSAVEAFLNPSAKARESAADQLVGKRPVTATDETPANDEPEEEAAPAPPAPSTVTVKVLNGSSTGGVARTMAQALGSAGYRVDPQQANADNANYVSTKVFYATEADQPAAEALANRIEGATTAPKDGSNAFTTKLLVVVGRTGTELGAAGTNDGTIGVDAAPTGEAYEGNVVPDKGAANVVTDPDYGRGAFVEVRTTKMPVLYPTVRETGSTFEEAYQYQFSLGRGAKTIHDAYRLVAKTDEGDYYGLQGTSWPNPSILEGPTREVVRAGRTYRLYFNGTKLHMVAWRQGSGTYWVANSVLNNLSNETMLAIADGVKPLR